MAEPMSVQIWVLATLFGGAGAAIVGLIIAPIKVIYRHNRLKKLIRREITFNIRQIERTIAKLEEFKRDYIQFERPGNFVHHFQFMQSSVIFNALINAGFLYDVMSDDQIIKFNNFQLAYTPVMADYLNEKIREMMNDSKQNAADKVDFFIRVYNGLKLDLQNVLEGI